MEEITTREEAQEAIQEYKEDIDKEIQDLIDGKVEADQNFKLEPLTEEQKSYLSKEEIEIYDIGCQLHADEEKKELDVLSMVPESMIDEEDKRILDDPDITEEGKQEIRTLIRNKLILSALEIANKVVQADFNKKAQDLMTKTYPAQIVNHYFKQNHRKYYEPTEEELANRPTLKEEVECYSHTICLDKILKLSRDPVFLNRLKKQCRDDRFNRHVDDLNFYIGKRIGNAKRTYANSVNILPEFIRKTYFKFFKFDIYAYDDDNNKAISRAYVYAMSEIMKKTDVRGSGMIEIYFYNLNIAMLAQLKDKSGLAEDGETCFNAVLEFVMNVYNHFHA